MSFVVSIMVVPASCFLNHGLTRIKGLHGGVDLRPGVVLLIFVNLKGKDSEGLPRRTSSCNLQTVCQVGVVISYPFVRFRLL